MHLANKLIYVLLFFFSVSNLYAKELISPRCEPLQENHAQAEQIKHSQGLLWKISKAGTKTSYLYGTIHVSDIEITTLPQPVNKALNESSQFVMEALPDLEQLSLFSRSMFFNDGTLLSSLVDKPIYDNTKTILAAYRLGADAVSVMKPWAAFLLMNYPPDEGEPLDMVLLSLAKQNGSQVAGLETLKEQAKLFSDLSIAEQVKLLTDTVCHYDQVEQDFQAMKAFYLKRDLEGLFNYAQRFSVEDKPVYEKLMKKLIEDRNYIMAERMQSFLKQGNAFVAIGAMHLPGKEGVLALLEKQGYSVSPIY
jgi:uncharacterized protein YbaP (TraB family)